MIVVLGLVVLVAAVFIAVAGVSSNGGGAHSLHAGFSQGFSALGYHVSGSTGTVFLYGIAVGVVAMVGLFLLFGGARRTSRGGRSAREGLERSRRDTASLRQDRQSLIDERQTARSYPASALGEVNTPDTAAPQPGRSGDQVPVSAASPGPPAL
jgi:hypothetical protein